jgi:hypothetical protein
MALSPFLLAGLAALQGQPAVPPAAPPAAHPPALPPVGALVVTLGLAPDGTISGCSAESRGGFPKVTGDAQCRQSVSGVPAGFVREQARLYRSLRVGIAIEMDQDAASLLPPAAGTELARRTSEVTVTAEGAPLSCRVLASVGPDPTRADACALVAREVAARPAGTVPGTAAHRVVVDFAIHGTPR